MFVMCPLVHNYSVIILDNWHLANCYPTQSNDHKTVDCECLLYSNKHHLHGCTATFCFLILE